jgi:hypothetical protein
MGDGNNATYMNVDRRVGGETGFFETVNILSKDNAGTPLYIICKSASGVTMALGEQEGE